MPALQPASPPTSEMIRFEDYIANPVIAHPDVDEMRLRSQLLLSGATCNAIIDRMPPIGGMDSFQRFYLDMNVISTPLFPSAYTPGGHELLVKNEDIQPGGSYEYRGGAAALMARQALLPEVTKLVTTEAQNAYVLALGARVTGHTVTLYTADTLRKTQAELLHSAGVSVETMPTGNEALETARQAAEADKHTALLDLADDVEALGGFATMGLEIAQSIASIEAESGRRLPTKVFVPVKFGSLISMACGIQYAREDNIIGDHVEVIAVKMAKGLAHGDEVREWAEPLLTSPSLVKEVVELDNAQLAKSLGRVRNYYRNASRLSTVSVLSLAGADAYAERHPTLDYTQERLVAVLPGTEFNYQ